MEVFNLSIIIPIHNEEKLLQENLKQIQIYCNKNSHKYEVILINNGSTDNTKTILNGIKKKKNLEILNIKNKNIGLALKLGMQKSKYPQIMFMPIDLPFGKENLKKLVKYSKQNYDLVLGSKGHPQSVIKISNQRKLFSKFYNQIIKILFNIKIRDTQGTFLIKKSLLDNFINYLRPKGPWIQAQLVIYSIILGAKIKEVPVNYTAKGRASKFNFRDAILLILNTFIDMKEVKKWQKNNLIKN